MISFSLAMSSSKCQALPTSSQIIDFIDYGFFIEKSFLMTYLLSQQTLPTAKAETYVEFRELKTTLSLHLSEEIPEPVEEEY